MKKKIYFYLKIILVFTILFVNFLFITESLGASTPKLISTLEKAQKARQIDIKTL